MMLRHATLFRHLRSIRRRGLLTSKSQGKMKVVWLHSVTESAWAVLHTVRRHGGRVEDVVVLEVEVDGAALRRFNGSLYYHLADVLPGEVGRALTFDELSASPVENGE